MTAEPQRREFLLAKGWVQAAVLVVLFGFFVLGLLAYRAYTDSAPLPQRVVTPEGRLVFTKEDILAGQGIFLRNGLMQYGSVFGHGAYLGPDYTADYLRRSALFVRERLGGEQDASAAVRTVKDFQTNRYDPATGTLVFSGEQAAAFEQLAAHYHATFSVPTTEKGLRPAVFSYNHSDAYVDAVLGWVATYSGTSAAVAS